MSKLIKLTDSKGMTGTGYTPIKWGINKRHTVDCDGNDLCSHQVIHAYENKYIALLMNTIHGVYEPFRMWEAVGGIIAQDSGLKCGVKSLKTIREITGGDIPVITKQDKINIVVILNAAYIFNRYAEYPGWAKTDLTFLKWSLKYLTGKVKKPPFVPQKGDERYLALFYTTCFFDDKMVARHIQWTARQCSVKINMAYLIMEYFNNNHINTIKSYIDNIKLRALSTEEK